MDNHFAEEFFNTVTRSEALPRFSYSSALCKRCSTIKLSQILSMSELRKKLKPCILCQMQSRRSQGVNDRIQILNSKSPLRICAAPGTKRAHPDVQLGFPVLPESESSIRFKLFQEWLLDCEKNHAECRLKASAELPTRVIDVGDDDDSSFLRLHAFEPDDGEEYIALSHCWGNLLEEQRKIFCTCRSNIEERHNQGFYVDILPKTFQDAVNITRKLGKRYLWIDSLCIIQYGDNYEDWKKESKRMEVVFRNAYCTIAATSAEDSTKGFLKRPLVQQPELQYIKVKTSSHGPIYISTIADNFYEDVENGVLNQRAWVLQERALSRRTIHFTANQSYFECGHGVRCETLTYMRNSKSLFLGDPNFPESLNFRRSQDKVRLFQDLFKRYVQLGLTKRTDRPAAISGLERRLAEAFQTECRYGIFEKFLHRSLLWQRSGSTKMKRILHDEVPSWSWMAYDGQIEYLEIESDQVQWNEGVRLVDNMLQAQVRDFQSGCKVRRKGDGTCIVVDEKRNHESGWLKYDGQRRTNLRKLKCVVVGREKSDSDSDRRRSSSKQSVSNAKRRYYILVVASVSYSEGSRKFKRVGVGSIPQGFILFRRGEIDEYIV